jgi:hypothetical protein
VGGRAVSQLYNGKVDMSDKDVKAFARQIEDTKKNNEKRREQIELSNETLEALAYMKLQSEKCRREDAEARMRKIVLINALAFFMRYFLIGLGLGLGSFVAMNILIWLGAK